jgi:transcriptional regulator with XRE-family HTH domain
MPKKNPGERLSDWIASKGWSKAEFARRMGILPQTVTKYVNGDVGLDNLAVRLMREGADVRWILTGEKTEGSEDAEMLALLRQIGITKPEQLQNFVNASEKIKHLATLLHNEVSMIGNRNDMGVMVRATPEHGINAEFVGNLSEMGGMTLVPVIHATEEKPLDVSTLSLSKE